MDLRRPMTASERHYYPRLRELAARRASEIEALIGAYEFRTGDKVIPEGFRNPGQSLLGTILGTSARSAEVLDMKALWLRLLRK